MTEQRRFRMFIDDTGEVDNAATNDPLRRFASITGVIFDLGYIRRIFDSSFEKLKVKHFGLMPKTGKSPVLHRRVILKAGGPFTCLKDEERRESWNSDCLRMYSVADYSVVTVGIDKVSYYYKYPKWNGSFYELLVGNAIERYFYFLRGKGIGDVMAEALSPDQDKRLKDLYCKFHSSGTDHINPELLQSVLSSKEIKIESKSAGVAGLQMADLLAKPLMDHCMSIYTGATHVEGFGKKIAKIVEEQKFYRDTKGNPNTYGRVWRPQSRSGPT